MDPWLEVQMSDDEREYNKKHAAPAPAPEPKGMPTDNAMHDPKAKREFWPIGKQWNAEHAPTGTGEGSELSFRPIEPVGAKILGHPNFKKWFEQGYASQEQDGLWLHYTAICSVLHDDAALRSQLEETLNTLGKLKVKYPTIRHSDEKWRQIEAKLKRDLATAQARIATLEEALREFMRGSGWKNKAAAIKAEQALAAPPSGSRKD